MPEFSASTPLPFAAYRGHPPSRAHDDGCSWLSFRGCGDHSSTHVASLRLSQIQYEHSSTFFWISFVSCFMFLGGILNRRRSVKSRCPMNPRAPISMVIHSASNPSKMYVSVRSSQRLIFLSWASSMLSSQHTVNSTSLIFLASSLIMTRSGHCAESTNGRERLPSRSELTFHLPSHSSSTFTLLLPGFR